MKTKENDHYSWRDGLRLGTEPVEGKALKLSTLQNNEKNAMLKYA